ncbi:MAG: O-antigen ligase family protein [Candidatus Omnitrophica bacterium]|nr:O-antigen ligase family protein [Candidatus Omnitrophota bacterium]
MLTGILLSMVLILSLNNLPLRIALFSLLVCLAPFPAIFRTSRMAIMGNFMAGVYALTMFGVIWPIDFKKKIIIIAIGIVFLFTGIVIFSDRNDAVSIVNVKKMMAVYNHFNDEYLAKKDSHVPRKFHSVSVYNPDNLSLQDYVDYRDYTKKEGMNDREGADIEGQGQMKEAKATEESSAELIGGYENNRQIVTYSSAVFRLLVWQDLIEEYLIHRPIFGFDFGKPVRSLRLEVLRWSGQWERDGWVPVHNSLLHMIYRTGIVGMVFIISMIVLFIRLTLGFMRLRSVKGILLCSIMVTWGVCANFLLTLEVPYTAVPVWSLYGMIFAYCQLKEKQAKEEHALEK